MDEVAAETFSALWPPGFPEGHCRLCSAHLKGIQETQVFWKLLLTSSAFWMLPAAAEPTSRGPLSPGGLRLCSLLAIPQVVTSSAPQTPPGLPGILPMELLTSREGGSFWACLSSKSGKAFSLLWGAVLYDIAYMHQNPGVLDPGGSKFSLQRTFDNICRPSGCHSQGEGLLASSGQRRGMLLNTLQPIGHPIAENHLVLSVNIPGLRNPAVNYSTRSLVTDIHFVPNILLL